MTSHASHDRTKALSLRAVITLLRHYHVGAIASHIARVQAVGWLMEVLAAMVFFIVIGLLFHRLYRRIDLDDGDTTEIDRLFFRALAGVPFATAISIALFSLTNPWLWIGLTHPDLAFAHELVQRLLAH